ncbi:UNVERIFIED_CONTAM: hypothetical protein FKN15_024576 [Acipenser sinensis]
MRYPWLCDCKQPRQRHSAQYQCLGLDAHGTLGFSVPQSIGASVLWHPRCSSASRHRWLCASVLQHPWYLEDYTPRRFDVSRFFEPVQLCPRCHAALEPRYLGASRTICLSALTLRGF